mmetsp:Transcript_7634/g.18446  ORF Transcript_7634/g.18446 Transcript_7634/m.18446 type:complete len:234 (-) Transcript_7634:761-1462(-)
MLYASSKTHRGMRPATSIIGSMWSLSTLIGRMPPHTISPREATTDGMTNPGQSQSITELDTIIVWKCFVLPGVAVTPTFFAPQSALTVEDLPTLGYPTKPIMMYSLCCREVVIEMLEMIDFASSSRGRYISRPLPSADSRPRSSSCARSPRASSTRVVLIASSSISSSDTSPSSTPPVPLNIAALNSSSLSSFHLSSFHSSPSGMSPACVSAKRFSISFLAAKKKYFTPMPSR